MDDVFCNILRKAHAVQMDFVGMGTLSVIVKYDAYYEEYLEIEFRNDDTRLFLTTMRCLDEDEAMGMIETFRCKLKEAMDYGE